MRQHRVENVILVEPMLGHVLIVGGTGRDAELVIDGRDRGHPLRDGRRIGVDQADGTSIGLGRPARSVMGLDEQFRAGRDGLGRPRGQLARRHSRRIGGEEVGIDRIDPTMAGRQHEHDEVMEHGGITRVALARPGSRRRGRTWGRSGSIDRADTPRAGISTVLGSSTMRSGLGIRQPTLTNGGRGDC